MVKKSKPIKSTKQTKKVKKDKPRKVRIYTKDELRGLSVSIRDRHLQQIILQAFIQKKIPSITEPSRYGMSRTSWGNIDGYDYIDKIHLKNELLGEVKTKIVGQSIEVKKYVPEIGELEKQVINRPDRV